MSRFLPPAWFLSAGVVALLVAGFGYADKTRLHWYAQETAPRAVTAAVAAPEPDRVVGVIRRCLVGPQVGETGDGCSRTDFKVFDDRLEVTIRTSQGTTYVVTVSASPSVFVGMTWPP